MLKFYGFLEIYYYLIYKTRKINMSLQIITISYTCKYSSALPLLWWSINSFLEFPTKNWTKTYTERLTFISISTRDTKYTLSKHVHLYMYILFGVFWKIIYCFKPLIQPNLQTKEFNSPSGNSIRNIIEDFLKVTISPIPTTHKY